MPLGGVGDVDAMRGGRHGLRQIALPDGLVLLFLRLDLGGEQRRARLFAIFDDQMLRRIARLFESLRYHQRNGLAPIADGLRRLLRRLVCGALRGARGQPFIVDHRDDAGPAQHAVLVDADDLAAGDGGRDQHAFGATIHRVFGCIGRRAGDLRQPFDTGERFPDHALFHRIQPVGGIGLVLLEMRAHAASSVACDSTACRVRRARGILKSFSP